jgi:hypothetical protein
VRGILIFSCACAAWAQSDAPIFQRDIVAPTDPRAVDVLKTVCYGGLATKNLDGKKVVGCRKKCPAETGFHGEDFGLDAAGVTFGHFLSVESEDAVVSVWGCEPHSQLFGGSYVMQRRDGTWRVVSYKPGLRTTVCHKVSRSGGRDLLLCYLDDGGQGYFMRTLYLTDLRAPAESEKGWKFVAVDNVNWCGGSDEVTTSTLVMHGDIERVEFTDRGMTVYARHGARRLTQKELGDCSMKPPVLATKGYQIDFTFDGNTYRVSAGSRDAARVFEVR